MKYIDYSGRDNLEIMKEAVNYNKYLFNLIVSSAKKEDCLVDFGAGNGLFSYPVAFAGYRLICVETDPVLSAILVSHGMTVLNDLAEAEDGSIDYIYSLNVLEHIEDDTGILGLWFRKLRPGGKLLVYVPAFQILFSSMDRKVKHIRRYNKLELHEKISSAGFDVAESRYADGLGFLASLIYKIFDKGDGAVDPGMLKVYDRWVFPLSRRLDVVTHRIGGKNVYVRAVKPGNFINKDRH
ncbi:methyltransferase family protein [Acidovorax sp. 94]|uniref:class I SAM-dependent methyltransferase n=1 Tax=Acidovorax sp. 94 TaxID=2135633 RepID=UPI000EADEE67|nr:class I SAM-dependent methyltransferase [Acidovorax sp. 94]RKR70114.1 methyltransferase family protein [Acidovorax sp. 94]